MSLKFGFATAVLLAASPIAAQPPAAAPAAPTGPQTAIQRTAMAFGQCISAAMQKISPSVTPEAGAAVILGGCAAQRTDLTQSVEAMIATLPEAQRAAAHAQFESQMGQAETQIADAIRQHHAAAAAAPAAPPH